MKMPIGQWGVGMAGIEPVWKVKLYRDLHLAEKPTPKFCPFCATPLPKPVPRHIPLEPVRDIIDGGYYCNTCHERLMCCQCWPTEARWEVP